MKFYRFFQVAVLFLCSSAALSQVIDPRSVGAEDVSNGIKVYWASVNETGVAWYRIERRVPSTDYFVLLVSNKRAEGSGTSYDFLDDTAFRTSGTIYQYKITPVNAAGQQVESQYYVSTTKKEVSSVRRTWGSIKAMFR